MTSEKLDEKAIFNVARGIESPEIRVEYLLQVCGPDENLFERVQTLLSAYQEQASFLESPPASGASATVDSAVTEHAGDSIGSYKLLQQIGEGGMGVVFMAEQTEPIQRTVALKIIKPGMDTRQVIARFEAERQAVAMMDHPNIAKVLDAGTTDSGRPYFVMELVKGVPITKYCDEKQLALRERLELFVQVCQAVQHAHQKGIIHRDIKPNNVLVAEYDNRAVPKVIDFGVAKATAQRLTERTMFTEFGQVLGTMEYMSPEQSKFNQLDIDTRSDIYSLGVLLYELLAGSTPFEGKRLHEAAFDEMLRIIREEEPPKPSTRLSSIDTLPSVAANRHTEPARLSKDLQGELDWIVMKALEKDRNRRYETASGFAADIERHLRDEPVEAGPPSAAYRFRKFALRNKAALATAITLGLAALVALGGVGGSIGWAVRDRQARLTTTANQVNKILQETGILHRQGKLPEALLAATTAQRLLESGGGADELRRRVQQWLTDLDMVALLEEIRFEYDPPRLSANYAEAFRKYGINVEALPTSEAADRIAARQIGVDLALALELWAWREQQLRNKDSAFCQRLLVIVARADPDPLRRRLREATSRKDLPTLRKLADMADLNALPVPTLHSMSVALASAGDEAEGLVLLRKVQQRHPGDFRVNSALVWWLITIGAARADEAVPYARAAVAVRPRNAPALTLLSTALAWSGVARGEQGRKLLKEAIAAGREAVRLDSNYPNAYLQLGFALWKNGQVDESIAAFREAIRLKPDLEGAHCNLGMALAEKGQLDDAIASCREAIRISPQYGRPYTNLGWALACKGLLDEAIAAHRESIRLEPTYAPAHTNLGFVLRQKGLLNDAVAAYRESVRLNWPDAVTRAGNSVGLNNVAWDYANSPDMKVRDPTRAIAVAKEAVALANEVVELQPQSSVDWQVLGWAHFRAGDWKASVASLEKSMELQASPKGGDPWQWFVLAMAHWQLGNQESAHTWYEQAIEWMDTNQSNNEQLRRFRAEAEELLKITGEKPTTKPPVDMK